MAQATVGVIRGRVMGVRTDGSAYSLSACSLMGSRPDGPTYPSGISVTPTLDGILLRWTAPTKNADTTPLVDGAINGYWVYEKEGSAPAVDSYDDRFWVEALVFPWPADNGEEHWFGITTVTNSGQQSIINTTTDAGADLKAKANFSGGYDNDPDAPTGGLQITNEYIGFYDSTIISGSPIGWIAYIKNDASFGLAGYDALGDWGGLAFSWDIGSSTPGNPATLIVKGTYKTSASGLNRIEIEGSSSAGNYGWLTSMDTANKERVGIHATGLEVWNASGKADGNRLLRVSATATDNVIINHDVVVIKNELVVGTATDPETDDDLYVVNAARLGSGTNIVDLEVVDHSGGDDPADERVVNVITGTGAAPETVSDYHIGTLYVKHSS